MERERHEKKSNREEEQEHAGGRGMEGPRNRERI